MQNPQPRHRHRFWFALVGLSVLVVACHAFWLPFLAYPLVRSDASASFASISNTETPNYLLYIRAARFAQPSYEYAKNFVAIDGNKTILILADQQSRAEEIGVAPNFVETSLRRFRDLGIPDAKLKVIGPATALTARERFDFTKQWLNENPAERLLVPTHDFSCGLHFDVANDILTKEERSRIVIVGITKQGIVVNNWWKNAVGLKELLNGYLALTHYWLFGEPRPNITWNPDDYQRQLNATYRANDGNKTASAEQTELLEASP